MYSYIYICIHIYIIYYERFCQETDTERTHRAVTPENGADLERFQMLKNLSLLRVRERENEI